MNLTRFRESIFLTLMAVFCMTSNAAELAGASNSATMDSTYLDSMQDYEMQGYGSPGFIEPPSARDPFTTSDKMFRASGQQGANRSGGQGFVPYLSGAALPKMRVRGFVTNGPGQAMALLQIEGEDTVHLVKKGDEIGIQPRVGQPSLVLKIINVDLKKVEVQSGSLRQIIIVQ